MMAATRRRRLLEEFVREEARQPHHGTAAKGRENLEHRLGAHFEEYLEQRLQSAHDRKIQKVSVGVLLLSQQLNKYRTVSAHGRLSRCNIQRREQTSEQRCSKPLFVPDLGNDDSQVFSQHPEPSGPRQSRIDGP